MLPHIYRNEREKTYMENIKNFSFKHRLLKKNKSIMKAIKENLNVKYKYKEFQSQNSPVNF